MPVDFTVPRLLLTGFEPFNQFCVNPSAEAMQTVAERFAGQVVGRRLPVEYHAAREALLAALNELKPAACLCMGLAPGDEFRLETVARKPVQFEAFPGESSLTGTWPWHGMEAVLREHGVPHRRSADAGQFVCESTYWTLLNAGRNVCSGPLGFLHVPAPSEAWPVERTTQVVSNIVEAYLGSLA